MIKKYSDLVTIDRTIANLYANNLGLQNTKFGYNYKRFADKSFYPYEHEYKQELTDIRVDHALIDEDTKAILMDYQDPRGFKYDKEQIKLLMKAENDLVNKWKDKEIEIEPRILDPKEDTSFLSEYERELFTGVII